MTGQSITDSYPTLPPPAPEPSYPPPRPRPVHERSPFVAAWLSVVPGLGNVYNGLYLRGLTFFLVVFGVLRMLVSSAVQDLALLIPALIFTWFFNIFDAYRQATLINYYGYAGAAATEIPKLRSQPSGGIVLGAAVFLLGLLGLLHQVIPDFDLSVVFDYWYLGFLAFGAWMIYLGWRDSRRDAVHAESRTASAALDDDEDVSAAA